MSNYIISVIIPVYNTRDFLQECLDSVLKQTIESTEIIFIDDGSDDGSWELIQEFQKHYGNIKSERQQRERQGAARNKGLDIATGDYIAFLDSDDTVPPNAYNNMYKLAQNSSADMVVGIQESFSKVKRWVGVPVHQKKFDVCVENTSVAEFPELLTDISVCNKLFRRTSLAENNITFPEQKSGEDIEFVAKALLEFKKISVIPEVVYNYRAGNNTSTGRLSPDFFKERVSTTLTIGELYKSREKEDLFQYLLTSELRKLVGNRLSRVLLQSNKEDQDLVLKYIKELGDLSSVKYLISSDMIKDLDKIKILLIRDNKLKILYSIINNKCNHNLNLLNDNSQYNKLVNCLWKSHINDKSLLNSLKTGGIKAALRTIYNINKNNVRPYYYKIRNPVKSMLILNSPRILCILKYLFVYVDIRTYITSEKINPNVWLIDERWAQSAEDNSYHFFTYIRTNDPDFPIYYIISINSTHFNRIKELGNVVELYSLKHMQLLHQTRVLISTDGFKALAYPFEVLPMLRKKTLNVFLQHGVSGNKTMTYYKERHPYFNLVITSNEKEKRSFINVYRFNEKEVALTGLSRFDELPLAPKQKKVSKILIAPTWRRWLSKKSNILKSPYYKNWNSLLTSERLIALLEDNEIQIVFQPHFNMMRHIASFNTRSKNIKVISGSNDHLQYHIISSDLLITDYSSVMYDFFYQLKPVFSFMFDFEDWCRPPNGPPLIDFEMELPLDIFYDSSKLIDALEMRLTTNESYNVNDKSKIKNIFAHRDHRNCRRIFQQIKTRL